MIERTSIVEMSSMREMSRSMLKPFCFCVLIALLGCTQSRDYYNECVPFSESRLPDRMYSVGGDSIQVTVINENTSLLFPGVNVLYERYNSGSTDLAGTARIARAEQDTLYVSMVGMQTEWIRLPAGYDSLVVLMRECMYVDHVN